MVDTKYVNAQEKERLDKIMRELEQEKRALADETQKFSEKQATFEVRTFSFSTTTAYTNLHLLRARNLHGGLKGCPSTRLLYLFQPLRRQSLNQAKEREPLNAVLRSALRSHHKGSRP